MKILWFVNIPFPSVIEKLGIGGQGYSGWWILRLAQELIKRENVKLGVVCSSGKLTDGFNMTPDGISLFSLSEERRHEDFFLRHDQSIMKMLSVINEFKPDIIEIHGTERHYGLITEHTPVPVVVSIQGLLTKLRSVSTGNLSPLTVLRSRGVLLTMLSYYIRSLQEKKIIRINKAFLGRTHWDRQITLGINTNARYYHCNEILRNEFSMNQWQGCSNSRICITSASKPHKGVDIAIKAISRLRKIGINTTLSIFGHFQASVYTNILKDLAGDENIYFEGYKTPKELIEEYSRTQIFVLPSRLENSSNSLAEAQMFGLPVIASDAGGTPSLVDDGVNGLLFKSEDDNDLAEHIEILLKNEGLARSLSNNARNKAFRRHDPNIIVKKRMDIYKREISLQQ